MRSVQPPVQPPSNPRPTPSGQPRPPNPGRVGRLDVQPCPSGYRRLPRRFGADDLLRSIGASDAKEEARRAPDNCTTVRAKAHDHPGELTTGNARSFAALRTTEIHTFGWTTRELFGLHTIPERPPATYRRLSRYDETGLIWLLQGRAVVALTESEAAIRGHSGATVVYRKHNKPALGPLGDCLDDIWGPNP
jgi:hypothetical protein